MASKRLTELRKSVADVTKEIQLLNAEVDAFKKAGGTAAEVQEKFGSKIAETTKKYTEAVSAVKTYESANKGNIKTNTELAKSITSLVSKLDRSRTAHNSLVSTSKKLTDAERELEQQTKKSSKAAEDQARADKKLADAAEAAARAQKRAADSAANARIKAAERVRKANEKEEARIAKRGDFFGGLASAFTPEGIGRAIGSVTKFVGIYGVLQTAVNGVREAIFGSIQAFIQFEDGLGRLGAVTGASAGQMQLLGDSAREVAVQTKFTTTEVLNLQISLAKLGATADQIPDLIFPIALAAQATGESLDRVGETIVKVNNQFGLSTSEVAVTAQTLVSAINESALSLDSFGTAIQYVGPIANQVGLSFQETAAFLGVLADNGFTASRIGTGLRTIFTDLKQSGVPLIDTLRELSERNIGVAEATELVGRRAAAQLLVLTQNIDVVKELSSVEEGLRSTLAASASQMATTAGQVDILKSAYEELKISIGETITQSNFFIGLIRIISKESAQLALGYKDLDVITKELGKSINDELAVAVNNAGSEFAQISEIIKQSSLSDEFNQVLKRLAKEGITDIGRVKEELEAALTVGSGFEPELTQDLRSIQNEGTMTIERLLGVINIYDELIDKTREANEVARVREDNLNSLIKTRDSILAISDATERLNAVTSLEKSTSDDILFLEGELRDERSKGLVADQQRIRVLQGVIAANKQLLNLLSDIEDKTEEENKKAKKAREDRAKADVDDIKRRKAQIREEIRIIREQRESDLKALKERAELQKQARNTTEERSAIELKLNQDITALNEKTNNRLEYQFGQFIQLSDDAAVVVQKYGTELPNVVEDLSENVNDLNKEFFNLSGTIEMTLSEVAKDAVDDATSILDAYKKQVKDLNDVFGDDAGKSQEYFEELARLTKIANQEVLKITDKLNTSSTEGQAAYETIMQLLNDINNIKPPKGVEFDWEEFWNELLVDTLKQAISEAEEAVNRFNDVVFENTKDRLESQRAAIQGAADIENDILKSQLENQLITEEEFRNRSEKNRKRQIARENEIDKQIFNAEKKRDKQSALSDYLVALASIIPNLIITDKEANPIALAIKAAITGGLATASYAAEVSAINQRQFYEKKFADGGIVEGPSHAQGGIPFTVQGRGGYEMEGGEFIVNKRAAAINRSLLERINSSTKPTAMSGSKVYDTPVGMRKFATGGFVTPEETQRASELQLEYLRAIAESNIAVAQNVSKPVRAFITQTDLRNNDLERRIVNKNSRL